LDRLDPPPPERAFLVQEFVADGVELFAGISRDPDFGLSLAFGMGGTAIEVTRDFALRMLPLREGDAEAMIAETRGAAMLASVRGAPAADVASVVACLEALADFAQQNADVLDEVDLNPIKALPQGRGCVVVDALIGAGWRVRGRCADRRESPRAGMIRDLSSPAPSRQIVRRQEQRRRRRLARR